MGQEPAAQSSPYGRRGDPEQFQIIPEQEFPAHDGNAQHVPFDFQYECVSPCRERRKDAVPIDGREAEPFPGVGAGEDLDHRIAILRSHVANYGAGMTVDWLHRKRSDTVIGVRPLAGNRVATRVSVTSRVCLPLPLACMTMTLPGFIRF